MHLPSIQSEVGIVARVANSHRNRTYRLEVMKKSILSNFRLSRKKFFQLRELIKSEISPRSQQNAINSSGSLLFSHKTRGKNTFSCGRIVCTRTYVRCSDWIGTTFFEADQWGVLRTFPRKTERVNYGYRWMGMQNTSTNCKGSRARCQSVPKQYVLVVLAGSDARLRFNTRSPFSEIFRRLHEEISMDHCGIQTISWYWPSTYPVAKPLNHVKTVSITFFLQCVSALNVPLRSYRNVGVFFWWPRAWHFGKRSTIATVCCKLHNLCVDFNDDAIQDRYHRDNLPGDSRGLVDNSMMTPTEMAIFELLSLCFI